MGQRVFIDSVAPGAIATWHSHRVLPSISIAQAILESGWGDSILATEAQNLFGIKASADWSGSVYNVNTREVVNGQDITIGADFRAYDSWADSIADHGAFFTSTPWRIKRYSGVIGETDYRSAAHALQAAGYATDPAYAASLIRLIEQYDLMRFDEEVQNMARHLIIAGHGMRDNGVYDPGACPATTGYREADVVREYLIPAIQRYDGGVIDYITEYDVYTRGNIGSFTNYDSVTELHFNSAASPSATGSEILIYGDYQPDATDKALIGVLGQFYALRRDGGFYKAYGFKNVDIAAAAGVNYRLIETCFISNLADMHIFFEQLDVIAQGIAQSITGQFAHVKEEETELRPEVAKWLEALYDKAHEKNAPEWAQNDLKKAVEAGITTGERPNDLATRAETAIMINRATNK